MSHEMQMPRSEAPAFRRPLNRMPSWIRQALVDAKLLDAYRSRPAGQRNDYLGWIIDPRIEGMRLHRLQQMLDELKQGDVYMNEPWPERD